MSQNKKFLHIGRLMAMGIVQGSSGVPFFSPPVYEYLQDTLGARSHHIYEYLCGSDMLSVAVTLEGVPVYEVRELLNKVICLLVELVIYIIYIYTYT